MGLAEIRGKGLVCFARARGNAPGIYPRGELGQATAKPEPKEFNLCAPSGVLVNHHAGWACLVAKSCSEPLATPRKPPLWEVRTSIGACRSRTDDGQP